MNSSSHGAKPGALDVYDETILANPEILAGERVTLHAERPSVEKREVRGRLATITRHPVLIRRTIEVDVLHEELHIDYAPGDGTEMLGDESETIVVLLHAEEVEVVKRVRVVEEVRLFKRRVTESTRFDMALQHERLDVLSTEA